MQITKPIPGGHGHRYFGPDLLRTTAIILVLFAHLFPGYSSTAGMRELKDMAGIFGVEIFFVLSGYLIGGILLKSWMEGDFKNFSNIWHFWKRRWFRTLPNYYLFLILFLLVCVAFRPPFFVNCANYLYFGQALLTPCPQFFRVSWSLAVEEWFYLLFPLLLMLNLTVFGHHKKSIWLTLAVFLSAPLLLRLCKTEVPNLMRITTFARLDAISYGVALVYIRDFNPRIWKTMRKYSWISVVVSLALVVLTCKWTNAFDLRESFFLRSWYFSLVPLSLAGCFPWLVELNCGAGFFKTTVQKISVWSYSLYLSHCVIALLVTESLTRLRWPMRGLSAFLAAAFILTASFIFSMLVYRHHEKPLMELREKSLRSLLPRWQMAES